MTSPINVLIAHGQRLYAQALGIALRRVGNGDLVVLPEHPASGEAVLDAVLACDPHVLLMDFWIPRHPQMDLLGDLRRRVPDVKVVLLSKHHGPHHIQEALNAGATGFLPTGLSVEQVAEALRQAHAGAPLTFAPELATLVDQIQHRVQDSTRRLQLLRTLTPREVEILQLLAEGRPGKDASKELGITHGSFKNAVRSIVAKTRARTHIDAVNMARYEGMVPQPAPPRLWPLLPEVERRASRPQRRRARQG